MMQFYKIDKHSNFMPNLSFCKRHKMFTIIKSFYDINKKIDSIKSEIESVLSESS